MRSSAPTWYSGPHASPRSALGEAELDDVREVLPRQVGVRDHDALRAPGGARRVHQPVDVVAPTAHARRRRGVGTRDRRTAPTPSTRPVGDADADEVAFQLVRRFVREVDECLVAHERARSECSRMNRNSGAASRQLIGIAIAPR